MVTLLHYLGAALIALVMIQIGLAVISSVRRQLQVGEVHAAELDVFRERLAKVRAQRLRVERDVAAWSGTRKFNVSEIVDECDGVRSFHLKPHDQKPIPSFKPGQFLTFQLDVPGQVKRVVRCYSLSDRPREDHYRVTVKRLENGV